jgi:hypothetical protein
MGGCSQCVWPSWWQFVRSTLSASSICSGTVCLAAGVSCVLVQAQTAAANAGAELAILLLMGGRCTAQLVLAVVCTRMLEAQLVLAVQSRVVAWSVCEGQGVCMCV